MAAGGGVCLLHGSSAALGRVVRTRQSWAVACARSAMTDEELRAALQHAQPSKLQLHAYAGQVNIRNFRAPEGLQHMTGQGSRNDRTGQGRGVAMWQGRGVAM